MIRCTAPDCGALHMPRCVLHLQLFEARRQWLSGCDELAGWLERSAQNVLQLEHSRRGSVWSQSAGANDQPFAECSALLQQRQYMVSALDAAQEEVRLSCSNSLHFFMPLDARHLACLVSNC